MRTKLFIALMAVLVIAGMSVIVVSGSSHNDAPLIAEDPLANNTDVYAFVSPDNPDNVTIIANYIPMVEPGDGPTHSRFSDKVLYQIKIDVDGDVAPDLTYQFEFENEIVNGNTFLYNLGPIGVPSGYQTDPTLPYANLNVRQTYTLTEVQGKKKGKVLVEDARVAPANIGPVSTPNYDMLADAAIHSISFNDGDGEGNVFVGPRDEGFFIDLEAAFDLLGGIRSPGVDTFSGFNVYSLALEIPKSHLANAGDEDGIVSVWATAERPQMTILRRNGREPRASKKMIQVSRLGNPLVNEILNPLSVKDVFNATNPSDDVDNIVDFIVNPADSQGGAALIPLIKNGNGIPSGEVGHFPGTSCTPENGRIDLQLALLTGIDPVTGQLLADAVPSLQSFVDAGGNYTGDRPADMLRLNYNVPPSSSPSSLGFLGGDPAGFPNGRRPGDDVGDIYLKVGAGAILHVLGAVDCPISLALSDNVDGNDADYLDEFPYLGTPHQGHSHDHTHGSTTGLALGIGSGLFATGIAMAGIFTVRRRRKTVEV